MMSGSAERVVYIVDEDSTDRRPLEPLLNSVGFRASFYAAPSAFLDAAADLPAGCALLATRIREMDGLELQERLLKMKVWLPVIIAGAHADMKSAVRAMKAGAVDFIEKPYRDEALIDALEAAMAQINRRKEIAEAARRVTRLSPREREVLDALAQGHPNKVIAYDLGISQRTVEVHRARMMDRLAVRQFAEAIRLAALAGLAESN